jgi:phthalate 4,5-cis-dihydrodiol dehydrogenase
LADALLNFGIIGIGSGASGLLRAFRRHPDINVTAVCDVRPDALARFAAEWGAKTYNSVEAFCKHASVDAVWVATPNHLHAPHAIAAANARKHVIVSKPMGLSLAECKAMIDAAERNGVKLMAGHTQGVVPGVRKMTELVQGGEFGRLGMIHSLNYSAWIYLARSPEELDVATGGGVVFRQAPHHIDMVRHVGGGMVRSVRAMTQVLDPDRPVPGMFSAYLEFEDGTPATIVHSGYAHFDPSELTFGIGGWRHEGGVLVAPGTDRRQEDALKENRRYAGGRPVAASGEGAANILMPFGLIIASCAKADIRQSPHGLYIYEDLGERREIELPAGEPAGYRELDEMYQSVVNGHPLIHDGRWGLATQEVTMAIMRSAAERREIMMQHQVPLPRGAFSTTAA